MYSKKIHRIPVQNGIHGIRICVLGYGVVRHPAARSPRVNEGSVTPSRLRGGGGFLGVHTVPPASDSARPRVGPSVRQVGAVVRPSASGLWGWEPDRTRRWAGQGGGEGEGGAAVGVPTGGSRGHSCEAPRASNPQIFATLCKSRPSASNFAPQVKIAVKPQIFAGQ